MAPGNRKFTLDYHLRPQKAVEVFYHHHVEADDGQKTQQNGSETLDWATFWGSLSAEEKTALQSIKQKLSAWLKPKVEILAQATEE